MSENSEHRATAMDQLKIGDQLTENRDQWITSSWVAALVHAILAVDSTLRAGMYLPLSSAIDTQLNTTTNTTTTQENPSDGIGVDPTPHDAQTVPPAPTDSGGTTQPAGPVGESRNI